MELLFRQIFNYYGIEREPYVNPTIPTVATLLETASENHLLFLPYTLTEATFEAFLATHQTPLLLADSTLQDFILLIPTQKTRKKRWEVFSASSWIGTFLASQLTRLMEGKEYLWAILPIGWVKDPYASLSANPFKRLFKFLIAEKKLLPPIYTYALVSGSIEISLPLAIQGIFSYLQTLQAPTGLYSLFLLSAGVLLLGIFFRLGQIFLLEILQRRIFAQTAMAFAHAIPRWDYSILHKSYPPELVNRFFDVISLQKYLAKLLLDLPTALLSLLLGFFLIGIYLPSAIILILLLTLLAITGLTITFPATYKYKYAASSEKYNLVAWLEETAKNLLTFKLAGSPSLVLHRTADANNTYLYERSHYFRRVLNQQGILLGYKFLLTIGILIESALGVTQKEITLGQFVATELVLFILLGAIDKITTNLETFYSALVSMEKISQALQTPQERNIGRYLLIEEGLSLRIENLSYRAPESQKPILSGIHLTLRPGEKMSLVGHSGSGKTTLLHLLYGLIDNYEGKIFYQDIELRQIHKNYLRHLIGDVIAREELFQGTIWENLTLLNPQRPSAEVIALCKHLFLHEDIQNLPQGYSTYLAGDTMPLPRAIAQKILLARALIGNPHMLFIDDLMLNLSPTERIPIYEWLLDPSRTWTTLIITRDPGVLALCDKVGILEEGKLIHVDTPQALLNTGILNPYLV
ncbi:MAG: ATP-binding cassette domain-containing protein [Bacteroidia bacterium]